MDEELKLCGEVISKIMILSQNQVFLQFIFENPGQAKFLYTAFLKFYEKFVKVDITTFYFALIFRYEDAFR